MNQISILFQFLNIKCSKVVLTFYKSFRKSHDSQKKVTGGNVTLNYSA